MESGSINFFPDPYSDNNSANNNVGESEQGFDPSAQETAGIFSDTSQKYQSYTPPQYNNMPQSYPSQQTVPQSQSYSPQQSPAQPYQSFTNGNTPPQYQPYTPQQYPQSYPPGNPYGYPMPSRTVKNTAGLVCGIISILLCFIPFLGLIIAIVGLCLSLKARSDGNKPGNTSDDLVIPGIICSAVGGIISLLISALLVIIIAAAISNPDTFNDYDYDNYGDYGYYDYYDPGEYT